MVVVVVPGPAVDVGVLDEVVDVVEAAPVELEHPARPAARPATDKATTAVMRTGRRDWPGWRGRSGWSGWRGPASRRVLPAVPPGEARECVTEAA
jgi:hypothetical protein